MGMVWGKKEIGVGVGAGVGVGCERLFEKSPSRSAKTFWGKGYGARRQIVGADSKYPRRGHDER